MKKGDIVVCVKCNDIGTNGAVQLTYGKKYKILDTTLRQRFHLMEEKIVMVRDDKDIPRDYMAASFKLLSEFREERLNELGI